MLSAEDVIRMELSRVLGTAVELSAVSASSGLGNLDPNLLPKLTERERDIATSAFRREAAAARASRAALSGQVIAGFSATDLDAGLQAAAKALAESGDPLSPAAKDMLATCGCDPFPPEASRSR